MDIVIIGAGGMAGSHKKAYDLMEDAHIIAVVDTVQQNALAISPPEEAEIFSSIDEMLVHTKPDIVDICVPSFLHQEYAIKCMKRGIHVFCEKPMAHSSRDANRMIQTAKDNHVCLMIGQVLRFWPEYEYLKNLIEEEPYGPLRHLQLTRQYGTHPPGSWYMDKNLCKMVCFEMHIHDADFVNYVFGLPGAVDSVGIEEPDIHLSYIHTRYLYDSHPAIIQAEGGWSDSSLPFAGGFKATFDHAVLLYADGILMLYPHNGRDEQILFPMQDKLSSDIVGVHKELTEFMDCIHNGTESSTVSLRSARDTIYLIEKEMQSAACRKPVVL